MEFRSIALRSCLIAGFAPTLLFASDLRPSPSTDVATLAARKSRLEEALKAQLMPQSVAPKVHFVRDIETHTLPQSQSATDIAREPQERAGRRNALPLERETHVMESDTVRLRRIAARYSIVQVEIDVDIVWNEPAEVSPDANAPLDLRYRDDDV